MKPSQTQSATIARPKLGSGLRSAWVGYQRRLDAELAAHGFTDRHFPDGRVLRICRKHPTSISEVGRELGITRQAAHKIVASLRARRFVTLRMSAANRSEKIVHLTPRAHEYLKAHRMAARRIERQLRAEVGDDALDALGQLLDALGSGDQPRMRDYLRTKALREP
jgi:DNA-binding MarR family transcriptional regulator